MSLRKLVVVAVTAVALMAGSAQADPLELTVNGDFETGDDTGWSIFESAPDQFSIITPGYDSEFAGCINNTQSTSGSVVKQANLGMGLVIPGIPIDISFKARGMGASGGVAFAEFFSEIEGGGVSESVLLGGAPLALDADPEVWTLFTFTVTTGPIVSGGVTLQFAAVTGADPDSEMVLYIDNVSVIVDSAVDTDASTWSGIKNLYR